MSERIETRIHAKNLFLLASLSSIFIVLSNVASGKWEKKIVNCSIQLFDIANHAFLLTLKCSRKEKRKERCSLRVLPQESVIFRLTRDKSTDKMTTTECWWWRRKGRRRANTSPRKRKYESTRLRLSASIWFYIFYKKYMGINEENRKRLPLNGFRHENPVLEYFFALCEWWKKVEKKYSQISDNRKVGCALTYHFSIVISWGWIINKIFIRSATIWWAIL